MTEQTAHLDTSTLRRRRWMDLQSVRASLGSGLLGGVCCIASGVATAAGLGAAGFFTTMMDRYQLYFIVGSVAVMVLWMLRHLRRKGIPLRDFRAVLHTVGQQAIVMSVVYVITLGIAMAAVQLVTM